MGHETEITERITEVVRTALKEEMMRGWSLDQLIPMLNNAIEEVIEELEEK